MEIWFIEKDIWREGRVVHTSGSISKETIQKLVTTPDCIVNGDDCTYLSTYLLPVGGHCIRFTVFELKEE